MCGRRGLGNDKRSIVSVCPNLQGACPNFVYRVQINVRVLLVKHIVNKIMAFTILSIVGDFEFMYIHYNY